MDLASGLTARAATFDDVDAVVGLLGTCEEHDDGMVEIEASDVVSEWRRPGVDPSRVAVLVLDGDRVVGFAQVIAGRAEVAIHPDHRGRGIGSALLRRTGDMSRADGRTTVWQIVSDGRADAPTLFRAHGYRPLYQAWIFDIPVAEVAVPVLADGYTLRTMDVDRDTAAVHGLVEQAFNEWPHRDPLTFDDWRAHVLDHERFAADISPVVVHDDVVVGCAIAFDYQVEGWVEQLAVAREHRHRGLGEAILLDVFGRFRDRGLSTVGLSTDTRTGARGLYERIGMRLRRSYTRWSLTLD